MYQKDTAIVVAAFIVLGVILAAGLIAVPAIEKAQASLIGAIRDRIKLHNDLRDAILGGGHTSPTG
jgi:signal transduction histidine kinase